MPTIARPRANPIQFQPNRAPNSAARLRNRLSNRPLLATGANARSNGTASALVFRPRTARCESTFDLAPRETTGLRQRRHGDDARIGQGAVEPLFLTASDGHDVQHTEPAPYRTVFISDVHLGAKTCQAERLLAFLRDLEADAIYLVGDIVDGWQLKAGWYWPQPHNDVVQKLLRKARKGTRLVYVPGNHD